jgi:heme/copper-type cytochrome/quinol oxidase subunit 4
MYIVILLLSVIITPLPFDCVFFLRTKNRTNAPIRIAIEAIDATTGAMMLFFLCPSPLLTHKPSVQRR